MKPKPEGMTFRQKLGVLLGCCVIVSHPVRVAFLRKDDDGYTMGWRESRAVTSWLSLPALLVWGGLSHSPVTLFALLPVATVLQIDLVLNTPRSGRHSRGWGESLLDRFTGGDGFQARNLEGLVAVLAGLATFGFDAGAGWYLIAAGVANCVVSAYLKKRREHLDADVEDARHEAVHVGRARRD